MILRDDGWCGLDNAEHVVSKVTGAGSTANRNDQLDELEHGVAAHEQHEKDGQREASRPRKPSFLCRDAEISKNAVVSQKHPNQTEAVVQRNTPCLFLLDLHVANMRRSASSTAVLPHFTATILKYFLVFFWGGGERGFVCFLWFCLVFKHRSLIYRIKWGNLSRSDTFRRLHPVLPLWMFLGGLYPLETDKTNKRYRRLMATAPVRRPDQ